MVKFKVRSLTIKNKSFNRAMNTVVVFCVSVCAAICPFDCGEDGCCYARKDDIVCKSYKQSNVFNISTILYKKDHVEAAALTFCNTYLCYLSTDDSKNACVKINDDEETTIDLPSGATGLLRQGHTHFIDYPRILYIFKHKKTLSENDYSLLKLQEDITFPSTANNYRIYEEKLCKFVNFQIKCTDGNIVDASDACPDVFQQGDTSIAYVLVVLSLLLVFLTICAALKFRKQPYEALDKTVQADPSDIKLEVEFSDVDLATTAEEE